VQLGFFFWPYDPEYTRRMASLGDALGFGMVGIADTPGNAMDAWVATAVAAQHIRRARVALCVTNVTTRHPAITATAAASVDLLAPDRVVLGVGSGHSGVVNVGSTATRPESLGTAVTFIRRLLRGEPATWDDGERAGANSASSIPWLRGRVPVYVAASGPKAMHVAGAVADGVFVNYGLQKEHVAHVDATVGAGARAAGRGPSDIETWYIACLDCASKR
jgi:5,10-methylenetetrahydromethanopterin reductase